ncbi:MAG: CoA-disulfide reductase [Actinomycetia bacterium]|nr:CoA-disulfide reductase [Actinomycetes bacterium]
MMTPTTGWGTTTTLYGEGVARERLVVIGGDAAGMSAASGARRRKTVDELEIVAFERGNYTSYAACGLPYFVADVVDAIDDLIARHPDEFRDNQDIDVHMRHEVVSIDLDRRRVTVRDLEANAERDEPFDQLVIATGAVPRRPALERSDAAGIFGIQTVTDGAALRDYIVEQKPKNAVVVGGGYIGLEMAEAMKRRGLAVTIVDSGPQVMSTLDPDMGAMVGDAIRGLGCEVHTGTRVQAFETDSDSHVKAVVSDQGTYAADLVVLGLGVLPDVALAQAAGITIGITGAIATDRRMATNVAGVWSAGDCVETYHRVARRPVNIALGTHANKQGRAIGVNATGGHLTFPGVIGTAVTKICELEVARTGLTEREATAAGFEYVTATIESTTRASYYPGASPITVKVLAERGTGRLIGAQIIGREGAAKRVDVMAAAIWNEMTAEEFASLDLGYAPPFSPVWDPTLIAARRVDAAAAVSADDARARSLP